MPWWFYLVAIPTAAFLVNGVPHFVHGVSGRPFPSPFTGGPPRLDTPVHNVIWAAINFAIGAVLLWIIREGLSDLTLLVELFVVGALCATGLAWVFSRPPELQRK